jgi:hypothetical protein
VSGGAFRLRSNTFLLLALTTNRDIGLHPTNDNNGRTPVPPLGRAERRNCAESGQSIRPYPPNRLIDPALQERQACFVDPLRPRRDLNSANAVGQPMAQNDIVLLDSLIEKSRARLSLAQDDSELFELFPFEQLLKPYEPSIDELEASWTDGGNDGGIDGFVVYVDQKAATPNAADWALRRGPVVEVEIIAARRSPTFEQQPLDSLISSLGALLNLRFSKKQLSYPYNEYVLQQRDLFKSLFVSLADRAELRATSSSPLAPLCFPAVEERLLYDKEREKRART